MSFFTALRGWLARKQKAPPLTDTNVSAAIPQDLGVRIERIPLPSGGEVVIVERVAEDPLAVVDVRDTAPPKEAEGAQGFGNEVLGVE